MQVMVIDVDDHDRVKLSRRRAMEELGLKDELVPAGGGEEGAERPERERGERSDRGRSDRPRRSRDGGGGGGRSRR